MHMADALLSPAVGAAMSAVSTGAIAWSAVRIRKSGLGERKVPVMAVAGAFVFAAQMINFTIPGTGSSGHIGGGILLSAMLGGYPAMLTLTAVLLIQALFFSDGGLLALGCNLFNMGVIPCLLVYPFLFRPLIRKAATPSRITFASIAAVVVGLQLGAFAVVLETTASGIAVLPFDTFALLMQPIHLAIGLVEGVVTAGILVYVHRMRPELLPGAASGTPLAAGLPLKKVLLTLGIAALIVGGALSLFASAWPDGLEWSMEKVAGTAELEAESGLHQAAADIQEGTVLMPDYDYASAGEDGSATGTTVAGIVGSVATFALAGAAGLAITAARRRRRSTGA
ncbi:MAG: energy-coupling factor ABC transporter permease [Clostridia bacterium]|nr:energy-coupling factor ABC transporter permease [Clostridia bacterium]